MKAILAILLVCGVLFGAYKKEDLNPTLVKAKNAEERGDYHTSNDLLMKEAKKDNPVAYEMLGESYLFGTGVERDMNKAVEYLKKAIAGKNKSAKITGLLLMGSFVYIPKGEYNKAYKSYTEASKLGSVSALEHIGEMYERGLIDGTKNIEKAMEFYRKAADQGNAFAYFRLGGIYYKNHKYRKALKYFQSAHKLGERNVSSTMLGMIYGNGLGGIEKNYQKAAYYYEEAAMKGNPQAMNLLAILYATGQGVEMDKIKAYQWWLKSARSGYSKAQQNLDILCQKSPWVCK